MSARRDHSTRVKHGLKVGAVGGMLGAAVMAMYAMAVSALVKDVGFFTPLYHIATSVIAPKAMMTSMATAAEGDSTYFAAGPALVGLIVHMMVGLGAGAVFGAIVGFFQLGRAVTIAGGVVYGLLVMVGNAFIALPIVANVLGGEEPIAKMPEMAGWGTFTVEHLLFGLVLGAVVAAKAAAPVLPDGKPLAARRV
jgi:uncharacterized membrane protein YagU involved in acid resistance